MRLYLSRHISSLVVGAITIVLFISFAPSYAASVLAAWSINNEGKLHLRTTAGASLKAFFQAAGEGKGDRVWVDFPGELTRPRSIPGNGPIYQVRLGKPSKGITRLVIEFKPSISVDPRRLKLIGTTPDRWELNLEGIPTRGLSTFGEGNVARSYTPKTFNSSSTSRVNLSNLPSVSKGRFKVVIDPGHGGPDPGAVGINGLRETDVVLDISLQVAQLLSAKGVKATLTRTNEIDLDLPPRVALANKLGADAFVSIHANASRNFRRDVNGLETFYFGGYRGLSLATNIQKQILRTSYGSPDRGVKRKRFFVIRRTRMPAVLVETGFVTGRLDANRLAQPDHRKALAFAIAKGILNYLREVG